MLNTVENTSAALIATWLYARGARDHLTSLDRVLSDAEVASLTHSVTNIENMLSAVKEVLHRRSAVVGAEPF